jgi:hypothetical protein
MTQFEEAGPGKRCAACWLLGSIQPRPAHAGSPHTGTGTRGHGVSGHRVTGMCQCACRARRHQAAARRPGWALSSSSWAGARAAAVRSHGPTRSSVVVGGPGSGRSGSRLSPRRVATGSFSPDHWHAATWAACAWPPVQTNRRAVRRLIGRSGHGRQIPNPGPPQRLAGCDLATSEQPRSLAVAYVAPISESLTTMGTSRMIGA